MVLFIASAVTLLLDYLIANSGAIGISAKVVPLITMAKMVWDLYQSFSGENMVEFADQVSNEAKAKGGKNLKTADKLEMFKMK